MSCGMTHAKYRVQKQSFLYALLSLFDRIRKCRENMELEACIDYIREWIIKFDHIKIFAWSALDQILGDRTLYYSTEFPIWKNIFLVKKCIHEKKINFLLINAVRWQFIAFVKFIFEFIILVDWRKWMNQHEFLKILNRDIIRFYLINVNKMILLREYLIFITKIWVKKYVHHIIKKNTRIYCCVELLNFVYQNMSITFPKNKHQNFFVAIATQTSSYS